MYPEEAYGNCGVFGSLVLENTLHGIVGQVGTKKYLRLSIEVKESVSKGDVEKFGKLVKYINAKKGVIVSSNQEIKKRNVEVVPAYMVEFLLNKARPQ
jgi:hypothetical protein